METTPAAGSGTGHTAATTTGAREVQRVRERFVRALIRGDEAEATQLVRQGVIYGWSPKTVYLDLLAGALNEVGGMWQDGQISVAHEHQATQMTLRQMGNLRGSFQNAERTGFRAVISAVEPEGHMVGAQIFAELLAIDGWDVDFLGSGSPAADLAKLVFERRPDLVVLSAALLAGKTAVEDSFRAVKSVPDAPPVLLGGRLVDADPDWASGVGAEEVVHDASDGLTAARRLVGLGGASVPLDVLLHRAGEKIRILRTERRWSQQRLAEAAGLDRTYLSALEHGKQNITLGVLKRIADALDANLHEIIPA